MDQFTALYLMQNYSRRPFILWQKFFAQFGNSPVSAMEVREFLKSQGLDYSPAQVEQINAEVKKGLNAGLTYLAIGDTLYPEGLLLMEEPPLILSAIGSLASLWQPRLAVVGSREPRAETNSFLDQILHEFLNRERAVLVSGGARGVDQRVHLNSLRMGLPTVAVIPSGLLSLYPQSLQTWKEEIVRLGGMLLSEYLPSQEMKKSHFEARNRIISGLANVVLVAEARKKSGSLITARCAIEQGKTVAVVPGHPLDNHFSGCLELLSDGAFPVRNAEDLLMLYRAESHFAGEHGH